MNLKVFALRGLASLAVMAGSNGVYTWYRARPVRHRDYWCVPNREPIPRLYHEASVISEAIAREDATWTAEMKELRALIEQQKPGDFNLANEFETTTKLRAYLEELLARGEKAKQILVELRQGPSPKLNDLLKQAGPKFLEFAAETRRYAAETQRTQVKRDYLAMADVWSAKARAAAAHQHDVERTLNDD